MATDNLTQKMDHQFDLNTVREFNQSPWEARRGPNKGHVDPNIGQSLRTKILQSGLQHKYTAVSHDEKNHDEKMGSGLHHFLTLRLRLSNRGFGFT